MTTVNATYLDAFVRKRRIATPWRRWFFRGCVVLVALVVCELQLQLASYCIPAVKHALLPPHLQAAVGARGPALLTPDALLGHRGNPEYPDHDRFGFRNKVVHDHPDIVALGDSQTHGLTNAEETWPAALERATNLSVYNMAIAGWGPVEYSLMLDAALQRKPKTIVVGLYLGNDIADAYRSVVLRGACRELASTAPAAVLEGGISEERWNAEISSLFRPITKSPQQHDGGLTHRFREVFSDHSRLYGVARAVKNAVAYHWEGAKGEEKRRDEAWARTVQWSEQRPQASILNAGQMRTVLTSAYRSALLDTSDVRNEAGLAITLAAIENMAARCRAQNVKLVVAIIPTKESVFDVVIDDRKTHPKLAELMTNEAAVQAEIVSALNRFGIPCVDAGEALQACVLEGRQPYPMSTDGHPNSTGNEAIAMAVSDSIISPQRIAKDSIVEDSIAKGSNANGSNSTLGVYGAATESIGMNIAIASE